MRKETKRKSLAKKAKYLEGQHELISQQLIRLQVMRSKIESEFEDVVQAQKGLEK